jgi:hypothetical protein
MKNTFGIVFMTIVAFIVTALQIFFGVLCIGAVVVAVWQACTLGPTLMTFGIFVVGVLKFASWVTAIAMTIISAVFICGKRIW